MSFSIDVIGEWLGGTTDAEDATFASLLIKAGGVPLTEVDDTIARSTRTSIRVPAVLVAEWLLSNWWRLRWEARPEGPARAWRHVHSMAALDSGFAWPPLEIASDGERIEIVMAREASRDAAAIRYLNGGAGLEIPAGEFDAAVDAFVDRISERIDAVGASSVVRALRDELRQERMDPKLARQCRWQARAGIDPGEAPEAWLAGIERVSKEAGPASTEDMLGATGPSTTPSALEAVADAMRKATTKVDLGSLARASGARNGERAAWVRGCEAATRARTELGIGEGPVSNRRLGEILGASLPVVATRPGPSQAASATTTPAAQCASWCRARDRRARGSTSRASSGSRASWAAASA